MTILHLTGWRGDSRHVPADLRRRTIDGRPYTVSGDLALLDAETLAEMGFAEYVAPAPEPETLAAAKARRLAEVRMQAGETITDRYPAWMQCNAALGLDPSPEHVAAMAAYIQSVRAESNRCEDLIESAETVVAVDAVTPKWREVAP